MGIVSVEQRRTLTGCPWFSEIKAIIDMTVKNEMDRFHLVMDTIERARLASPEAQALYEQMQKKLIKHNNYIVENGEDMPEIRNWKWPYAT